MALKFYSQTKEYVISKLAVKNRLIKHTAVLSLRRNLVVIKRGLAQETIETKEMLNTYHRYTQGKASDAEMKAANKQFGDVLRSLGLGIVVILPFSPITIPAIVKLGDKFGVTVLPSSFDFSDDKPATDIAVETITEPAIESTKIEGRTTT